MTKKKAAKKDLAEKTKLFKPAKSGYKKEDADSFKAGVAKLSFDPITLTEKIIEFGKVLTGVPIYDYQYFPIFRIIYSVVTVEGADISLLFSRQSGKCFAKGTRIRMADGTVKEVELIKNGEYVMGVDGTPRLTSGSTNGTDEMFEVTPRSGYASSYTVNKSHILALKERLRDKSLLSRNLTIDEYLEQPSWKKADSLVGYRAAPEFPEQPVLIDPYYLGLWLGDGNNRDLQITNIDPEPIDFMDKYAKELGGSLSRYNSNGTTNSYSIVFNNHWKHGGNKLLENFRLYSLFCNKHIPLVYLINSREVRLRLIAGLIDSDGNMPTGKGKESVCEITFKDTKLAEDVRQLALSLGFRVSISKKIARIKSIGYACEVNRICLYGELWTIPTLVKRKQRTIRPLRENPLTFGFDLVPKGVGEFYGFKVDKDSLFLLEDFTVVHNSEAMAFVIDTLAVILPTLAKVFPELDQYKNGIKIGLFAPQGDQTETTYSRAMMRLTSDDAEEIMSDPDIETSLQSTVHLNLTNGSYLFGQVVSKISKIESKTYDLVIIEEAQDTDSYIVQKSIEPMTSACVCGDTKIYDASGVRHIIEDYHGASIMGYNEKESKVEPDSVTWLDERFQHKESYQINFASGRMLRCSYDHPILYRERKGGRYGRKLSWVETESLNVGTHVALADKVDLFGTDRMFDPRLVGMLIGDGSYRFDGMVRFCSCDEELLNYVKNSYEFKSYKSHITKEGKTFEDGTVKGLCGELRKLGMYGQVGASKTLPQGVDYYCKEDICELVAGIFDTDGFVSIKFNRSGIIGVSTISEILIEELMYLLDKFGIHGRKIFKPASKTSLGKLGYWQLSIRDKKSIIRFSENFKFIVGYKQERLSQLVSILNNHQSKTDKNYPELFFDRVIEVVPIGVQAVYNLTADNNHTYLANGVVTHNTNGTIVKVGTTGTRKNHFWEDIQSNRRRSTSVSDRRFRNHFEYDYKDVIKYKRAQYELDGKIFHLNYEKDVLRKRQKWGEDSDAFRLSYALIWALDVGMFLSSRDWDNLTNNKRGYPRKLEKNWRMCAGLDLGKSEASTVLTIGYVDLRDSEAEEDRERHVTRWIDLSGDDYDAQFNSIMEAIIEYEIYVLALDYTGVGKAFGDRLMAACQDYVIIIPYTFSRPSKSDMWLSLQNSIRARKITVPANKQVRQTEEFKKFDEQMNNLNKYYEGSYLVCQKADEVGAFDDYPDSLGLFNIAASYISPDEYEIEDEDMNPLQERLNDIRRVSKFASW